MSICLLAFFMPLVYTLRMPINWVRMPNTGSTTLCRRALLRLPRVVFSQAWVRSYSSVYAVMVILRSGLLPMHSLLNGQPLHWLGLVR